MNANKIHTSKSNPNLITNEILHSHAIAGLVQAATGNSTQLTNQQLDSKHPALISTSLGSASNAFISQKHLNSSSSFSNQKNIPITVSNTVNNNIAYEENFAKTNFYQDAKSSESQSN